MTTVNNRKVSAPSDKGEDPKQKGSFNQSKSSRKETRDWADLIAKLAIPIVVLIATIGFGWWQGQLADVQHQQDQELAQQQHDADQKRALDQQRASIL
jgi:uncharacterized protein HemX